MFLLSGYMGKVGLFCFILLVFIVSTPYEALAQVPVHQQLYWTRLNLQIKVSPDWQVNTELENRRFFNPDRQQQALFQAQALKLIRKDILVGAGVSLSWVYNYTKSGAFIVPEIRPFQLVVLTQRLTDRLLLQHRYRIDERFFHNQDGSRLTRGYRFNWRFSYQAQLSYPVSVVKPGSLVKITNDIMINAGKGHPGIFDQYRFYGGFEYPVSAHWAAEAGYMYVYQQGRQNLLIREALRLTLFGRFNGARHLR